MQSVVTLTDTNFSHEALQSSEPVLVDFWAEWCGPCRMIAPMIEEIAVELQGKVKVGKLDVDSNSLIASQFGIRSIPTLLIFKDGKVVDQIVGAVAKQRVVNAVLSHQ